MLSTPSLESYDKLKTEFNTYRTQAEDNQRELNKTIKHLKETKRRKAITVKANYGIRK